MLRTHARIARIVTAVVASGVISSSLAGQSRNTAATQVPAFDAMEKSIEALQRAMQAGEVTSRQLVDSYLLRIDAYDKQGPALNAIVATNPQARSMADSLDAERSTRGSRGPLHGIPVLVKDNYETMEMPTSAGSIALASFHPHRDAFQVQRLKAAGAVILGKTNMHELAQGIATVGSRFGLSKNPYDLDRNPGGSSGGTGAAIPADPSASLPRRTTWSACAARRVFRVERESFRCRARRISVGRSRVRSPIWQSFSTPRWGLTPMTCRLRSARVRFPSRIARDSTLVRSRVHALASSEVCSDQLQRMRRSPPSLSGRSMN
jgi:amidase